MRLICTLLILLTITAPLQSQKLIGVWRGYFVQKAFNEFTGRFMEDRYKYEVQINQLPGNAIEGVTYSYKNIVFTVKHLLKAFIPKEQRMFC